MTAILSAKAGNTVSERSDRVQPKRPATLS